MLHYKKVPFITRRPQLPSFKIGLCLKIKKMKKSFMTPKAARRIQSAGDRNPQAKTNLTGFYQRAQASVAKGKGGWPSTSGEPSGWGRDNNPPKK